jgi:hypothetical protein
VELLLCDIDPEHARRLRETKPYTGLRKTEFYL